MADTQIRGLGDSPAPLTYTVPGAQEIVLKSLFASFDGSAATSAWFPCVRVRAPGGGIVGEYITQASVVAGASADVSFAPFLRGTTAAAAATSGLPNALMRNAGTFLVPAASTFTVPLDTSLFVTTDGTIFDSAANQILITTTGLYVAYAHILWQEIPPVSAVNLSVTWTNPDSLSGEWVTPRDSANAQSGFSGVQPNNDTPLTSDYLDDVSMAYVGYATGVKNTIVRLVVVNYDPANSYHANAYLTVWQVQPIPLTTVQTYPTFP